jgi:hypothetical protein
MAVYALRVRPASFGDTWILPDRPAGSGRGKKRCDAMLGDTGDGGSLEVTHPHVAGLLLLCAGTRDLEAGGDRARTTRWTRRRCLVYCYCAGPLRTEAARARGRNLRPSDTPLAVALAFYTWRFRPAASMIARQLEQAKGNAIIICQRVAIGLAIARHHDFGAYQHAHVHAL